MSHLYTPKVVSNGLMTITDDGTNIVFAFNGTNRFRVVKASGQFQVAGDYDAGISL